MMKKRKSGIQYDVYILFDLLLGTSSMLIMLHVYVI